MRPIIGVVVGLILVRWPPARQAQPDADNLANLGPHTKTTGCQSVNGLPAPDCTPGARADAAECSCAAYVLKGLSSLSSLSSHWQIRNTAVSRRTDIGRCPASLGPCPQITLRDKRGKRGKSG
jgi:hypothetical protein